MEQEEFEKLMYDPDKWDGIGQIKLWEINRHIACCERMSDVLDDGYMEVSKELNIIFFGDYSIRYCPFCKHSVDGLLDNWKWINYMRKVNYHVD